MKWILERLRQRRVHRELAEEIEAHIAERIDDLIESGMNAREARQKAMRDFGNAALYLETSREVWSSKWLEELLQDVRYAARTLRRSPVFTAVIVLSLTLGIGANTAIFSLMDAVMWHSLPVQHPEELWVPHFEHPVSPQSFLFNYSGMGNEFFFSYNLYRAMRDDNQVAEIAAYSPVRLNVSIDGAMEPPTEGQRVSGNYFSLLGVEPVAGKAIGLEDDRIPNGHPVAMISHSYWKRRFGLDPSTVGRTMSLAGTPFKIIGVTPPEFFGVEVGTAPDIFVPVAMQPKVTPVVINGVEGAGAGRAWLQLVMRLKPGVTEGQALEALQSFHVQTPDPPRTADTKLKLSPAATGISGLRLKFSRTLFILMAVVGIVLLIACANIANLLLARASARRPEFAVRLALGAGRWRVVRQLLVESVLLATLGGVCGGLLAQFATRLLVSYMSAGRTPIALPLNPDFRVLAFTASISILTGILFGLVPALRATRMELMPALKNHGDTTGSRNLRPGKVLVVAQVSLSLLLLVGAGLFVRSLRNLDSQDSGFPRETVLVVRVEPKDSNQRNMPGIAERLDRIYSNLLHRIVAIPGVRSASMGNVSPTKPESGAGAGALQSPAGARIPVSAQVVYPAYFETLGLPIVAGRDFSSEDLGRNSPPVCIVNEAFAELAFPDETPIGRPCMANSATEPLYRIVGLVKDSRYTDLRGAAQPVVYQPFLQANTSRGQMILHVRIGGGADSIIPKVREEVWKTDKNVPQYEVRTLAEEVNSVLIPERLVAMLSSSFGALALLLASLGLYGVLGFSVIQRTGELGIRMALGARRRVVMWMILGEALLLVLFGISIGVPAALAAGYAVSSRLSGMLFKLEATDPLTIAIAAALLALVAAVAAYVPARRGSRVAPMTALRHE